MSGGRPGFTTHLLRYSTSNLMVIAAGLVSFPILTRLLDNTQYGILNYYDSWVLMGVAIGKLGAQHAIMRFYPHGGDAGQLRAFSTNLFFLPLGISLLLWVLVVAGLVSFDLFGGARQSPVFWMALASAPLLVFASLVETVLRISEKSHLVMVSRIGWRWGEVATMVGAVLLLQHSAVAAYGGKLAAAGLMVFFYLWWMRGNLGFSRAHVDRGTLRKGLVYGFPLVANEIVAVAFILLDRVMIKGIIGNFEAVGIYSIGAALAMQVNMFTNITVFEAFTPMANRLFTTDGPAAVRALKQRVLPPLTYALVGIAALLWCFGADAVIALSGHSKSASGPVFAMVGAVYALMPVLLVSGYGLLLEKRTLKVLALTSGSLVVNTALNLWLIPTHGVMGAVYATAASSAAYAVATCAWVPRDLLQLPQPRVLATALVVALACIALVSWSGAFGLASGWPRLVLGGGATGMAYVVAVLALDARLRTMLLSWRGLRMPFQARGAG
ncbi:lipopolysaccharide biosynthesis protein [Luteimonas lutimaris]|uniref:Polysaccharide biosynthesis protein C-terminal domain-containing protein n=1 Tax=Luteimonas lutimaris TaxID=698645 RepID=A0ABP7MHN6_9GAMM